MTGTLTPAQVADLISRQAPRQENETAGGFEIIRGTDLPGGDLYSLQHTSLERCQSVCAAELSCAAFTHNTSRNVCFIKGQAQAPAPFAGAVSGRRLTAAAPAANVASQGFSILANTDLPGGDYRSGIEEADLRGISLHTCEAHCAADTRCRGFTFNESRQVCFLKSMTAAPQIFRGATSGIRVADPASVVQAYPDIAWRDDDTESRFVYRVRAAAKSHGGSCEAEQAAFERLAGSFQIVPMTTATEAGSGVELEWTADVGAVAPPSYVVVSTGQAVRFSGEGFYTLMPDAIAPFGIETAKDRTRAIVALYGSVPRVRGTITVIPLVAGELDLDWAVVGYVRQCEKEVARHDTLPTISVQVAPAPTFFVNDPFSLEVPAAVIASAPGTRHVEVYDGRYRLLDTGTGTVLAERNGVVPRFSPTGRFLVAARDDGLDMLDTMDGEQIVRLRDGNIGWENADSFVVVGTDGSAGWGGIFVSNTLNPELSAGGATSCRICSGRDSEFRIDLENDLIFAIGSLEAFWRRLSGTGEVVYEAPALRDVPEGGAKGMLRTALRAYVSRQSGVAPLHHSESWEFRGGLKFTLLSDDHTSGLDGPLTNRNEDQYRYLVSPLEIGEVAAPDTEGSLVGMANLGLARGAARISPSVRRDNALTSRLAEFGLRFSEFRQPALVSTVAGASVSDEIIARRIVETVPGAHDAFGEREYETSCGPEGETAGGEQKIYAEFSHAFHFEIGDRDVWVTHLECSEGNALFFADNFYLFDSDHPSGFVPIDGENPDTQVGTMCFGNIGFCEINVRLYDDQYLLVWSVRSRALLLYDIEEKKTVYRNFDLGRGDLLKEAFYSTEDRLITQINTDGSFYVYDVAHGKQVMEGRYVDDEIIAWTPDLRFDATPEGANYVNLRFPGQQGHYNFQQFSRKVRVPGLVAMVFDRTLQATTLSVGTPPRISGSLEAAEGQRIRGRIAVDSRAGAVELHVFQDGLRTDVMQAGQGRSQVDLDVARLPGARWVSVLAFDEEGLASLPIGRDLASMGDALPSVHLVAIGIDRYEGQGISSLRYAGADTNTLRESLSTQHGKSLTLASDTVLLNAEATRHSILEAAEQVVTASREGETIVFSFAGHGLSGSDGRFYMATSSTELHAVEATALAWDELSVVLQRAKARVVIFLDACHSGAAGSDSFASNDDAAAEVLKNIPSGLLIFSASKGRQLSEENAAAGGGIFTNAVADVIARMRDDFDLNGNGVIEISELYVGVKRRVTEQTDGRQTPWLARNQMVGDFALF